jgi:hypothetical protein
MLTSNATARAATRSGDFRGVYDLKLRELQVGCVRTGNDAMGAPLLLHAAVMCLYTTWHTGLPRRKTMVLYDQEDLSSG